MSQLIGSVRGASSVTQSDRPAATWPDGSGNVLMVDGVSAFTHSGSSGNEELRICWNELIDELLRILMLDDNWDGEGSEAPDRALVSGAIKLAQNLKASKYTPADRVIASVNGTVYFEWHTPHGYQEIEVISPLDAELRWLPEGSDMTQVVHLTW